MHSDEGHVLGRRMKPEALQRSAQGAQTSKTSCCMRPRHGMKNRSLTSSGELGRKASHISVQPLAEKGFSCDVCKSPYVVNPCRRRSKKPKQKPTPRHRIDPETKRRLNLCNACGLASTSTRGKSKKIQRVKTLSPVPSLEQKQKYLVDACRFARSLVKEYNDSDAERLFCPQIKKTACGCIQKYITAEGDREESRNRGLHLLKLIKEATRLSQQKCYNIEEVKLVSCKANGSKGPSKCTHHIGLGNGQKKSKMFEDFVLKNRSYLRDSLKFCERATQKVLVYSNNFLHKRLKTVPERLSRVRRQKGKAAMGLLIPIELVQRQQCCSENCVSLAVTHSRLLQQWRERVLIGQAEARRVLAEMLTPSGGARSNCYKFISMVTGCSNSTICRVSEQMKVTGGDREPPEHGLKKWFEANPRSRTNRVSTDSNEDKGMECSSAAESTSSSLVQFSKNVDSSIEEETLNSDTSDSLAVTTQSIPELKTKPTSGPSPTSLSSWDTFSKLQLQRQQLIQLQSKLTKQQRALQQKQQLIEKELQQHILQRENQLPSEHRMVPTSGISQVIDSSPYKERITNKLEVVVPTVSVPVIAVKPTHPSTGVPVNNDTIKDLSLARSNQPTRMIVDVPCSGTGNVISFSLLLNGQPIAESLVVANDVNEGLSSNLTGSGDQVELSTASNTRGNLVLIQPSCECVLDAIPVVMAEMDC